MSIKEFEFGELSNDKKFIEIVLNFDKRLDEIEEDITEALKFKDYDKLSTSEKVKYDTYLTYSINSLYWMHQKLQGVDTNNNGIKHELARVQECMVRDKKNKERKTIRPVLDKGASDRFVRHGLHIKKDQKQELNTNNETVNKKIKFKD